MSTAGWAVTLDRFADHLAHQRQLLEHGAPDQLEAFQPCTDLGPLPPMLLPRARELQAEAQALVDVLIDARARTAAALERLAEPQERARPAYVDSRA